MKETCKNILITTPIYYVNDKPHIGHAYTTVIADFLARYSKLLGHNVMFMTGTDEHGQKIKESADKRGISPKELVDEVSTIFRKTWDEMDISYDYYARTTDKRHEKTVKNVFKKMYDKGDIYKDKYEGYYCVSCESFVTKAQMIEEGKCPMCSKELKVLEEESYFFKLSAYKEKLLKFYEENEDFILPHSKKNDVMDYVNNHLEDLSITRTSFDWGVPIPQELNDDRHFIYVWLDALFIYASSVGMMNDEKDTKFWPPRVQVVGKDIIKFHAVFWPAFLMSIGEKLPKHLAVHGWWTINGEKMSKSIGNVVSPLDMIKKYNLESFKYFLLSEIPFGKDGDFDEDKIVDKINARLSNDYGNLINRTINMGFRYCDGKLSKANITKYFDEELKDIEADMSNLRGYIYKMQINRYIDTTFAMIAKANGLITKYEPWNMIKEDKEKTEALLALIANIIAKTTILVSPILHSSTYKIAKAFDFKIDSNSYNALIEQKELIDVNLSKLDILFPKLEKEKIVKIETKKEVKKTENLISIDEFSKVEIRVGIVEKVEEVEGSNKLLKLQVNLGEDRPRTILSGIKKYLTKDDLLNQKVCIASNLKPAKLMGMTSEGMLITAKTGKKLTLVKADNANAGDLLG